MNDEQLLDAALLDPNSTMIASDYWSFVLTLPNGWKIIGSRGVHVMTGAPICNGGISLLAYDDDSEAREVRTNLVVSADDFRAFVSEIAQQ